MPINTSYAEQSRAFPGMLSDLQTSDVITAMQGEASAEIPFGAVVVQGTASTVEGTPDDALLPVDATSVALGVVLHSHDYQRDNQVGATGVKVDQAINVLRRGTCYALVEGDCVKGGVAFVRHTADVNAGKGVLRKDADTAEAAIVRGITFAETITTSGIKAVLVNVDIAAGLGMAGLT